VDKEEVIVNLMDIVPFDDASRARVKDQIDKLNSKEEVTEFLNKLLDDVYTSREKKAWVIKSFDK
jgi:hypothetical protein